MLHYLLPRLPDTLYKNLLFHEDNERVLISNSLSFYLNDIKESIKNCSGEDNEDNRRKKGMHRVQRIWIWDTYKKLTNPYEFIHTYFPREGDSKLGCVAIHRPLSRSYFKMVELMHWFDMNSSLSRPIKAFHLAEGPGGFIEALVNHRRSLGNKGDTYYGMTLSSDIKREKNIVDDAPGWKKTSSFLRMNPNVIIETGADNTGNIMSLDNFVHVTSKFASTMDIITADGGFDFSSDYNNQEVNAGDLIFCQIAFAVCMQNKGGSFVIKVFDMFTKYTTDMISLLASMYQSVHVTKPCTSRHANSERYIVCRGFHYQDNATFYPFIYRTFVSIVQEKTVQNKCVLNKNHVSSMFISKIEECNAIFGQQQIENIHHTIQLIQSDTRKDLSLEPESTVWRKGSIKGFEVSGSKNDHILLRHSSIVAKNISKCITWCKKHKVPYDVELDKCL